MEHKDRAWVLPGLRAEVPKGSSHPGAFGAIRKFDRHTGVDLYAPEGQKVVALEDGVVVTIDLFFTGGDDTPKGEDGTPIWHQTAAVLVESVSGVLLYGEITPARWLFLGAPVYAGQRLGTVKRVLKEKSDHTFNNPANSPSMLHFELYRHGTTKAVWWKLGEPQPEELRDPTELLLSVL